MLDKYYHFVYIGTFHFCRIHCFDRFIAGSPSMVSRGAVISKRILLLMIGVWITRTYVYTELLKRLAGL